MHTSPPSRPRRTRGEHSLRTLSLPLALITAATAAGAAFIADKTTSALLPALVAGVGASLIAVLTAYTARRLTGLGAVASALDEIATGQRDHDTLHLSDSLGPRARAFNTLLTELNTQSRVQVVARAADAQSRPARADSELASAIDALWVGMLIVDSAGRIRYANGAAAIMLSSVREKLQNTEIASVLQDQAVLSAILSSAKGTTRVKTAVESASTAAEGTEGVLRYSVRAVGSRDQSFAVVVIDDVTQQRVAERSRSSFVAQATHELRTPLTNMRLCLDELLESENLEDAQKAKYLNIVSQESRRLERMVGDMLSISEIEAGTLKLRVDDVRLNQLFEELTRDHTLQAQDKNVRLAFKLPPKLPVIQGDRDKLVLCLSNLIANAIKYTPAGGEVTVAVRTGQGPVAVDITDTGIGISPDEQELVFERFYRSKDQRVEKITGTGLGLALARQVARLHGGDITLTSQLNKGSTFTLIIPESAPSSSSSPSAPSKAAA